MRTVFAALFLLMLPCHSFLPSSSSSFSSPSFAALRSLPSLRSFTTSSSSEPTHGHDTSRRIVRGAATAIGLSLIAVQRLLAEESAPSLPEVAPPAVTKPAPPPPPADFPSFRLPYNHENLPLSEFLGKATIVFNMKLDDPQTISQFPSLLEVFNKYSAAGLHVLAFPTEQGYFEPDDDETIRAKCKEYYGFGDFPKAVVFDKIDLLGPSAHPLYAALTTNLLTPNNYSRITLNYEKFLLDGKGKPVRRYPRKFSAYDMEQDIVALLEDKPLPEPSPAFDKAWREAKREAVKSEYAFRYNYNYYTSPDSMYKYNPGKDRIDQ